MKRNLIAIAILALAGVAVSAYALWQHYAPLGAAFCNIGETFSCDLVNKSAFSEVLGVPVAGIGIAGYLAVFALVLGALVELHSPQSISPPPAGRGSERGWGTQRTILRLLITMALVGFGFSAYLTYVEFFVIGAVCVLCVTSQTLILAISAVACAGWRRVRSVDAASSSAMP